MIIAAVVVAAACSGADGGPSTADAVLSGTVTAGPTCPVAVSSNDGATVNEHTACAPRPVEGAHVRVSAFDGRTAIRVFSDADGYFEVTLQPGSYEVSADPVDGLVGVPDSVVVTVIEGGSVHLELRYDTGIR